jgi:acetate kinase
MILILNTGSSSLKYKLFDKDFFEVCSGNFRVEGKNYSKSVGKIIEQIHVHIEDIKTIGHRVVHGGGDADEIMPVSLNTMKIIEKYSPLAPLHNPPATEVIKIAIEKFPQATQFAAFDTAYFKDLPELVKTYPIDRLIAEKYSIVKYGFHGFSHQAMALEFDPDNNKKIITMHLGAGCSASAISSGKPIDTSMGFTPVEGLPMQTRSGDLDPEIFIYLAEKIGVKKTKELIEYNSGLAGISGKSGDMLELLDCDDHYSKLAIEIFCYRAKKYLGAYTAVLGGLDSVVFSGEIGFGSELIRKKITSDLDYLEFKIEKLKQNEELIIAKKISKWNFSSDSVILK